MHKRLKDIHTCIEHQLQALKYVQQYRLSTQVQKSILSQCTMLVSSQFIFLEGNKIGKGDQFCMWAPELVRERFGGLFSLHPLRIDNRLKQSFVPFRVYCWIQLLPCILPVPLKLPCIFHMHSIYQIATVDIIIMAPVKALMHANCLTTKLLSVIFMAHSNNFLTPSGPL